MNLLVYLIYMCLGDCSVGKSCILKQKCERKFYANFAITVGMDFRYQDIRVDDQIVKVMMTKVCKAWKGSHDIYSVAHTRTCDKEYTPQRYKFTCDHLKFLVCLHLNYAVAVWLKLDSNSLQR